MKYNRWPSGVMPGSPSCMPGTAKDARVAFDHAPFTQRDRISW